MECGFDTDLESAQSADFVPDGLRAGWFEVRGSKSCNGRSARFRSASRPVPQHQHIAFFVELELATAQSVGITQHCSGSDCQPAESGELSVSVETTTKTKVKLGFAINCLFLLLNKSSCRRNALKVSQDRRAHAYGES